MWPLPYVFKENLTKMSYFRANQTGQVDDISRTAVTYSAKQI